MECLYRSPILCKLRSLRSLCLGGKGQCIVGRFLAGQEHGNTRDHIGESCLRVGSRFGGGLIVKSPCNANCQPCELAQTETD